MGRDRLFRFLVGAMADLVIGIAGESLFDVHSATCPGHFLAFGASHCRAHAVSPCFVSCVRGETDAGTGHAAVFFM
jgi:hypothetical protein